MEGSTQLAGTRLAVQAAVVRALAESTSLEQGAARVLAEIGTRLGWPLGGLWELDDEHRLLRPVAQWARPGAGADEFTRATAELTFQRGVGVPGRAWERGAPIVLADFAVDDRIPRARLAEAAGLQAAVGLPIHGEERVIGAVEFYAAAAPALDEPTIELLDVLGHQIGLWLERRRAGHRVRESERLTAAMIASSLDCVVAMDADGRVVEFNPAAERTFGYTREEAVGSELASLIIPPELRDRHRAALRRHLETGEASILGRRLELVALRADGSRLPVELTVVRIPGREPPLFTGFVRDITDRKEVEQRVAQLLEAEQMARELAEEAERRSASIAATLQRSLLPPRLPEVPGARLAAVFRAAGSSVVGGDFYDVFETGPETWGVVVGDVAGKGPEAASVTALTRYTVRAAAMREQDPAAVLRLLNEALLREGGGRTQCTVAYACLHAGGDGLTLRYALGGHPEPLLLRADGSVETLAGRGLLLGGFDDPPLESRSAELRPGETLLIYTDGVTDVRTPDGLFGTTRLAGVLAGCAELVPEETATCLESAVVDRPGHVVRDDVAMLVIAAAGSPGDERRS